MAVAPAFALLRPVLASTNMQTCDCCEPFDKGAKTYAQYHTSVLHHRLGGM
jgi:hypothetical protein